MSKRELMEWVELPEKGWNKTVLLQEFEKRTMLNTSKVLLFINSVNPQDQEKVKLLLEMDKGLTTDWMVVKRVCSCFDKRREWNDESSSLVGPVTR